MELRIAKDAKAHGDTAIGGEPHFHWTDLLKLLPSSNGLRTVLQLLRSPQPLKSAATFANQAALIALHPIAQHRPWTLVLGAAAVGGVMARTTSWRWLFTTVVVHGLIPVITTKMRPSSLR
jgi:hypothetical protein